MALSVGDRLTRYEIRGFVGAGGMGEVYRAHDEPWEALDEGEIVVARNGEIVARDGS